jgi:hypothetical protein
MNISKRQLVLLNRNMKQFIDPILSKIHSGLSKNASASFSLLSGRGGSTLFNFLYSQHYRTDETTEQFQQEFQDIAENSVVFNSPTFCGGKAGINWLFTYLYKNEYRFVLLQ